MGQPGPTQVDTGQLRAIGDVVRTVATDLAAVHKRHAADLAPAQGAGWSCVPAAGSASTAWSGFLASLARTVEGTGDDLRTAADEYQAADQAGRTRVGRAGRTVQ